MKAQDSICLRLTFLLVAIVGFNSTNAHAATRTWTGGHASSANWNLRDNWGGVAVPTHGDALVFPAGAARLQSTNNIAGLRLSSMRFEGSGDGFSLRGNGVTLSNGITVIAKAINTTISELVLQGGVVHTGKGAMTLNGDLTANSSAVTAILSGNLLLTANGSIEVSPSAAGVGLDLTAHVSGVGSAGLTKTGAGSLRLAGANTYLGHTVVNAGTLRIGHESALGATSSGTTATNSGGLFIEHTVHLLREPLTLARTGGGTSTGVLRVVADVTIATNVVLTGPTLIRTIGDGYLTIDGVITGTGPLTHRGEGTLQLAGHSANTFTGSLHAEEGVLLLSKLSGSAVQGDLLIGTTNTSATARHTRSANLGGAVTVNAESVYDLDGNNESIDALTLNGGGDVETGAGQLTLNGDVVVNVHPGPTLATSGIRGRLHVGTGERRFIVKCDNNGVGGLGGVGDLNELVIFARVAGSANIIKSGPGDLNLTASNSFTGTLTVEDGELYFTDAHGLGTTSGRTIVTGNASLIVFGSYEYEANGKGIVVDEPLFLNTTGQANGSALFSFGSNVLSGSIFLAQNSSVNVFTNHVLHLAGVINGHYSVTNKHGHKNEGFFRLRKS